MKRHQNYVHIKRVNKRTHDLPDETKGRRVMLFKCEHHLVVESKVFVNHRTCLDTQVLDWTHYMIIPDSLYP